jgi:hypothetical protein
MKISNGGIKQWLLILALRELELVMQLKQQQAQNLLHSQTLQIQSQFLI